MKKRDIDIYSINSDDWHILYVAVNPDDCDGDIFAIGNSLFGDKTY